MWHCYSDDTRSDGNIPVECGVMGCMDDKSEIARMAPKRGCPQLPFGAGIAGVPEYKRLSALLLYICLVPTTVDVVLTPSWSRHNLAWPGDTRPTERIAHNDCGDETFRNQREPEQTRVTYERRELGEFDLQRRQRCSELSNPRLVRCHRPGVGPGSCSHYVTRHEIRSPRARP